MRTGIVAATLAFVAGWWLGGQKTEIASPRSTPARPAPLPTPAQAPGTTTASRGSELARSVCGTCHLVPEPALLTKTEWAHHVLPEMARWLGLEAVDFESRKDGRLLQAAGIYPPSPVISVEDWLAIWDHYVSAAPTRPVPPPPKPATDGVTPWFRARKMNFHTGLPAISLVKIDAPRRQLLVGDAFASLLGVVDMHGAVSRRVRVPGAPVHAAVGERGLHVTLIGQIYPSDALDGAVGYVAHQQGDGAEIVLDHLRRPVATAVGDVNADGRADLVVCAFGNRLGRLSWFEAMDDGSFEEHPLLEQPGVAHAELRDLNHDGRPDLVVLRAQAREGISLFLNEGAGRFTHRPVVEQHPAFGYTSLVIADVNGDGHDDLLTANGDNGDHPTPHRSYHGVRLLTGDGQGRFQQTWFHPLEGAYKALAADFDADGDVDIAAIAYFPDFTASQVEAALVFENQGRLRFVPRALPEADAGRWMVMDAGDLDGDGDTDLALGSYLAGPTTIPVPSAVRERWRTAGAAVLLLENVSRHAGAR
ncbi:MAG TPA: VCBS repeat-containing protein [Methylomirabilota bacterium]|nr:VCBS repeat-containing protein [Methylomirabilota bacterium]